MGFTNARCISYEKFFAHGGDWGGLYQLGHNTRICSAVHTHTIINLDFSIPAAKEEDFDDNEKIITPKTKNFGKRAWLLSNTSNKTTNFIYAINDSPIGLCAWLIEKKILSDCNDHIESIFSKDDLINTTMIYWLLIFGTSARYYYEAAHNLWSPAHTRQPS